MAESKELQQIVEQAVAQVLERQLPKLQAELVARVLAELPAVPACTAKAAGSPTHGNLVQAVASIHAGTTQKEILRALLDAGSLYGSRVALFVVKAGAANGWQGRGLGEDDAVKDFPLDMTAGPAAHAYQNRTATPANIAEMDRRFVNSLAARQTSKFWCCRWFSKIKLQPCSMPTAARTACWTGLRSKCWCWPRAHGWK